MKTMNFIFEANGCRYTMGANTWEDILRLFPNAKLIHSYEGDLWQV